MDAHNLPRYADHGFISSADRVEDGRAAVFTDIEGDGDLDLLVQSYDRPAVLLVNQGDQVGNWLHVQLAGTLSNRDAIGARVIVAVGEKRLIREVTSSAGYLAGQSLTCYFGLGEAERVEQLEVLWPSGQRTMLSDLAVNRRLHIIEEHPGLPTETQF